MATKSYTIAVRVNGISKVLKNEGADAYFADAMATVCFSVVLVKDFCDGDLGA